MASVPIADIALLPAILVAMVVVELAAFTVVAWVELDTRGFIAVLIGLWLPIALLAYIGVGHAPDGKGSFGVPEQEPAIRMPVEKPTGAACGDRARKVLAGCARADLVDGPHA